MVSVFRLLERSLDGHWITACLSVVGAGLTVLLLYRAYLHPLARFPGPRLAALTGLWRTYHYARGDWHKMILPLHQKYGRIVRLAPDELSIIDESAMKALYGHGTIATKGNWYKAWQPPGAARNIPAAPNILATQNHKVHSEIRRRVTPPYKMMSILKMEEYIQQCFDNFWQKLDGPAASGENVDMCKYTNALAFDVIGEICYGESIGMLEGDDAMEISSALFGNFVFSTILGHIWGQLAWIDNALTRAINLKNPMQKVGEWSVAKVKQHFEMKGGGNHSDIIDQFIAYRDSEGKQASLPEIVDSSTASIAAGADPIATTIRGCLYYLIINPEINRKLQAEVDDFYEQNNLMVPITYHQTQQLPYLIRESLRMVPAIPAQLYCYAPADGINVDGQHITPGTLVGMSALAQNRDKAIFGEDADVFRPERWLEDEAKSRYQESALLTFGGNGSRSCLGRDLAMVELHKFLAQMMRKFDFELLSKERPFLTRTYFFSFQSDMWMKIVSRSKD